MVKLFDDDIVTILWIVSGLCFREFIVSFLEAVFGRENYPLVTGCTCLIFAVFAAAIGGIVIRNNSARNRGTW